jgi:hypothetical protein
MATGVRALLTATGVIVVLVASGHAPATQIHQGDIVLSGSETQTIEGDYRQVGDIHLSGNAMLTVRNGTLTIARQDGDPRADVNLSGNARLTVENASLVPATGSPDNLYLLAEGTSSVVLNKATFINVLNIAQQASLTATSSSIYSSAPAIGIPERDGAFGIVQACCQVHITMTDTTVGSIALFFGADDVVALDDLKPNTYSDWRLSDHVGAGSTVDYEIVFRNSRILPTLLKGPFERGWAIFADPATHLQMTNSVLNKFVFSQFEGVTATFANLNLDKPTTLDYRDIHISDTTIANEWGFFGRNSNLTIQNSQGVWLWPMGSGNWKLANGMMIEYDPRGFTGTLTFADAIWRNAGEIFENSNHTIGGTVRFQESLDKHLVLSDSTVTRQIPIRVRDARGRVLKGVPVQLVRDGRSLRASTDASGTATFTLTFDERSLRQPFTISVTGKTRIMKGSSRSVTFFTDTPIALRAAG